MEFLKVVRDVITDEPWMGVLVMIVISVWFGLIIMYLMDRYNVFYKIRTNINKTKERHDFQWSLPVLLFDVVSIIFIMIYEWLYKHRNKISTVVINTIIVLPMILHGFGVIKTLPIVYSTFFVFYVLYVLFVLISLSDKDKTDYDYDYDYYHGGNTKHYKQLDDFYVNPKPRNKSKKPKGLTKLQISNKKKGIRLKLTENKEIQEKYNL